MSAHDQLGDTISELSSLQGELRDAVDQVDPSRTDRLLAQIGVLERRRNRLVHQMLGSDGQRLEATPPLRDQIQVVLRLLGRPSSIRLVADVARARFGEAIHTGRIASLRRDEERSWSRAPGARPAYVLPALSADRFAPVRGELTLSSWPLETRIVGPASPRVDMLLVLAGLVDEFTREREAPWTRGLERIIWRLASTVPGAVQMGEALETSIIQDAVQVELAQLRSDDERERRDAAERARDQLDDQALLFGTRMRVVDGGLVTVGGSA